MRKYDLITIFPSDDELYKKCKDAVYAVLKTHLGELIELPKKLATNPETSDLSNITDSPKDKEQGSAITPNFQENDLGDKPLAYDIKKQSRGHYIRFTLLIEPQKLTLIEKAFKLIPNLLKFVFIRLEEEKGTAQ